MRWTPPQACLLLAVSAAGCGDEETAGRTVTVPAIDPIRVVGDEYSFDPGRIVVSGARRRLEIALVNRGSLAHNIEVMDGERVLGRLRSFPAGEKRTLRVRVPPGSYRLVCTVGDHEALGMTGELEVRP